jgi:hypothetical protein
MRQMEVTRCLLYEKSSKEILFDHQFLNKMYAKCMKNSAKQIMT